MAQNELKAITKETQELEKSLKGEMGAIDQLKTLLNVISAIKNQSMDMEFRIIEVQEQFRVLNMYNYEIDEDIQKEVDTLMTNWEELLEFADKKDFEVNDFKKNFAEVTKQEVETFKTKIIAEFEKYKSHGPGTASASLEEGAQLLQASKEQLARFATEREANVLAEKLFNLPISKFPELVEMEEKNKQYDLIYTIYKEYQSNIDDFSVMSWSKLDASQLILAAEKFEKDVKRLSNKHPEVVGLSPFNKLKDQITGFKDSLPLIEQLKLPAIQERHWKRIMEETGREPGDINLKSMNLSKVFELEL